MNLEKLKDISIIAMCISIASIVALGGGFIVVNMIISSGRNGFD